MLVVQPKNWGISLARLDFTLERQPAAAWTLRDKKSRLIPGEARHRGRAGHPRDRASPITKLAERYLNTPVATSPAEQTAALGRVEDTALVDAIQQVQLFYSQGGRLVHRAVQSRGARAEGPGDGPADRRALSVRQRTVRDRGNGQNGEGRAGERRALLPLLFGRALRRVAADESRGDRVQLRYGGRRRVRDRSDPAGGRPHPQPAVHGAPLAPDRKLRIAINNYRAAGSAGYSMFTGAKIVWRSSEEIRDLMVRYYTERKTLPGERAETGASSRTSRGRRSSGRRSKSAGRQRIAVGRVAMKLLWLLPVLALALYGADLTGKWTGTVDVADPGNGDKISTA